MQRGALDQTQHRGHRERELNRGHLYGNQGGPETAKGLNRRVNYFPDIAANALKEEILRYAEPQARDRRLIARAWGPGRQRAVNRRAVPRISAADQPEKEAEKLRGAWGLNSTDA